MNHQVLHKPVEPCVLLSLNQNRYKTNTFSEFAQIVLNVHFGFVCLALGSHSCRVCFCDCVKR